MSQRAPRLSAAQNEVLVTELEKRNKILFGKFNSDISSNVKRQHWEEVASRVNSVDGPRVTAEGIQTRWKTIRHNAKKRKSTIVVQQRVTGGGKSDAKDLTQVQERVLQLTGEDTVIGFAPNSELGLSHLDQQNPAAVPSTSVEQPVLSFSCPLSPVATECPPPPPVQGAPPPKRRACRPRVSTSSKAYLEKLLQEKKEGHVVKQQQLEVSQQIATALSSMNEHLANISASLVQLLQRPHCSHE